MMNFRQDKKKNTILNALLSVAVLALLIVLIFFTPISSWFSRGAQQTGSGLWRAGQNISETSTTLKAVIVHSKKELLEENEALRNELESYQGRLLAFAKLRTENEDLKQLLNVPSSENAFITARVLARPSQSVYNTLVIQAGQSEGVTVGDMVTAYGTVALGEVVKVSKDTATVKLYSSPDVTSDVVLASSGLALVATGKGSGNFRLELPRDVDVENGTQLLNTYTNLIMGTVQATIFDPREPFQTVVARSPVNVRYLKWVQIVK